MVGVHGFKGSGVHNIICVYLRKSACPACPVECLPCEMRSLFLRGEAYSSGVSEKQKIQKLCALCVSSEAGGEYKLTYLHSKASTTSVAKSLMG